MARLLATVLLAAAAGAATYWRLAPRPESIRQQHIKETVAMFDATLDNMPQGVALYDEQQRIRLANRRYAEMYGLTANDIRPGMSMKEILQKRVERGVYIGQDPGNYVDGRVSAMATPSVEHGIERFADGRVIEKSRKPMPSGGWLSVHEDITARQQADDRITYLAHHDALTGLVNRTMLAERLEAAYAQTRRSGATFSILLLDLDDFKLINDTLGHPIGDRLLQIVAERLLSTVRDADTVARIGGDEFAVLQPAEADVKSSAGALAERLMEVISAPYTFDGLSLTISLSIGIAVAPSDGVDASMLQKNADLALYQAKASGRHCVRFFDPEMDEAVRAERTVETALRLAQANGEFEMHYQAVVGVNSGAIIGMEALLRWRHPTLGMVPPDRFIRIAEKTGLIHSIGRWVLMTACHEAAAWPENIRVAVNLSPAQFKGGDLIATVREALQSSGLKPSRLTLEITETTLLERSDCNLEILQQLREIGVAIALDDFGTGYSSLSYLKTIPFDVIKIDRSFVVEMETNARSAHIVAGIVALSRSLEFITVAEGVETQAQLDIVRAVGCTAVQGYFFARPKPARELVFDLPLRAANAA